MLLLLTPCSITKIVKTDIFCSPRRLGSAAILSRNPSTEVTEMKLCAVESVHLHETEEVREGVTAFIFFAEHMLVPDTFCSINFCQYKTVVCCTLGYQDLGVARNDVMISVQDRLVHSEGGVTW